MWQRFTERARKVVFYAQEEAGKLGQNYVSTEHVLLGLVREPDCVATRVLGVLGVSLDAIKTEVERVVERGDGLLGQDMQLTPAAKHVIDLGYEEARTLNDNYIGTEHLLLGLIREGEGLAGRVLASLGVDLEKTRTAIRGLERSRDHSSAPVSRAQTAPAELPRTRPVQAAIDAAMADALSQGLPHWTPLHLAVAVFGLTEGMAFRLLKRLNVDPGGVAASIQAAMPAVDKEHPDSNAPSPLQGEGWGGVAVDSLAADASRLLAAASSCARSLGDPRLCTDHLLIAFAGHVDVAPFLNEAALNVSKIVRESLAMRNEEA